MATPVLMGILGKQQHQQKITDQSSLDNLLGNLIQGNSPQQEQSFLDSIHGADGDRSIIDDVAGMVLDNWNKKSGGLNGPLGGLFGKK